MRERARCEGPEARGGDEVTNKSTGSGDVEGQRRDIENMGM